MRLHFYGTKGYVEEQSPSHSGHSAFTIEARGFRLLCDFGENRRGMLDEIGADAIWISHAHPDHAWGLRDGADVRVFASEVTHEILKDLPIRTRAVVPPNRPVKVGPFRLTACPVVHSVRCPGSAVRIETSRGALVYSGDIVSFEKPEDILGGADLYVGDGSTLTGSLVRRHPSGTLIGHTTVRAQLGWLAKAGVPRALFSHFGKGPIEMGDGALQEALSGLAEQKAPRCQVTPAADGMEEDV